MPGNDFGNKLQPGFLPAEHLRNKLAKLKVLEFPRTVNVYLFDQGSRDHRPRLKGFNVQHLSFLQLHGL